MCACMFLCLLGHQLNQCIRCDPLNARLPIPLGSSDTDDAASAALVSAADDVDDDGLLKLPVFVAATVSSSGR